MRTEHGLDCPFGSDYRQMLERDDIDIVSVCTIHSSHYEQTAASLEAGKHVMVEKPLCTSLEQARRLKALTEKSGRKTAVGFVVRWYSGHPDLEEHGGRGPDR